MQVTNINPVTTNFYTNKKYDYKRPVSCKEPSFRAEIPVDVYKNYILKLIMEGEINTCSISDNYKNGLRAFKKLGDFTISEYKNLTQDEIDAINEVANEHIYKNKKYLIYNENFNKCLRLHDIIATGIKNKLNILYGEGNYVVIPIGRSLSSIGKCLGYKIGEDNVKPLPLSCAGRFLNLEKCKDEDYNALCKYLDSIGLSKKEVETSGKKYIFIDYCYTGKSLKGAENLFKSDNVYGNLDNIEFIDIIQFLKKLTNEFPNNQTFIEILERYFTNSHFKKYSVVKECYRLSDTTDSLMKPEDYKFDTRIFMFKLMNNEIKN